MKEIEVGDGSVALVDDEDWESLKGFRWHRIKNPKLKGAQCFIDGKSYCMHRMVMGINDRRILVRHKNGDFLDNQKANLRVISYSQSAAAMRPRANSGYKGVRKTNQSEGRRKPWCASIFVEGKFVFLGEHDTKQQAAWAYDRAAERFFGEDAKTNGVSAP